MSLFSKFFSDKGKESDIKVRQSNEDNSKIEGDRYTHTGNGGHVHDNYKVDTATGSYKEYSGGENSSDRSYNK